MDCKGFLEGFSAAGFGVVSHLLLIIIHLLTGLPGADGFAQ